jgi:hypothetical protein
MPKGDGHMRIVVQHSASRRKNAAAAMQACRHPGNLCRYQDLQRSTGAPTPAADVVRMFWVAFY